MRAKVVVTIPTKANGDYPSNVEFEDRFFSLGLGDLDRSADFDTRSQCYKERAKEVWCQFPEVANDELEYVAFFARLPFHGWLIVTRYDEGNAVLRILNEDLAKLESDTETLVKNMTSKGTPLAGLEIVNNEIEVYERQTDRVVMRGKVLNKPYKETLRRQPGTKVTALVTASAVVATFVMLRFDLLGGIDSASTGSIERFSTAMLATFFVSLATMTQTYVMLRRNRSVDWDAVSSTP